MELPWLNHVWNLLSGWLPVLNLLLAIPIIFLERRSIGVTWAWLMVLLLLPLLGFIIYLIFGQNLARRSLYKLRRKMDTTSRLQANEQVYRIGEGEMNYDSGTAREFQSLIHLNLMSNQSVLTQDNEVEIFTTGEEKFNALLEAMEGARSHIHLLYYKISSDELGRDLRRVLLQKVKEGVEVRVIYDAIGSPDLPRSWFQELKEAGGEVHPFFPSLVPYFNLKINFRNHRKICVIDGTTGFVGGFNIGNEYLGLDPAIGEWRDTHLKLRGSAVHQLQVHFFLDWSVASSEVVPGLDAYFPRISEPPGRTAIQIVSSGPNTDRQQIKTAYIKLIHEARESICLQTPYFVPDESVMTALKIAAMSGVDVKLMVPHKGDHRLVQWATQAHIGELLKAGASCYLYYKGFLHAKTIVVDGKAASVGTANLDHRSFELNFEVNAFIYDRRTAGELQTIFERDLLHARAFTLEHYKRRPWLARGTESMARLLSPIL